MFTLVRTKFIKNTLHKLKPLSSCYFSSSIPNFKENENSNKKLLIFSILGAGATWGLYKYVNLQYAEAQKDKSRKNAGCFISGIPKYTAKDVSKHATIKDRVWVTYKEGVYDITDFISKHPGGDNIMLGAGASIEPFWEIYGIHKTDKILEMLEEMRIGNIDLKENEHALENMGDPYANDPVRHPILTPRSVKPFNAEPVLSLLVDSFNTPNEIFYVRNHLPVPTVDIKTYEIDVEIEGSKKSLSLKLDDLKKYPEIKIPATIMCAGNRRSEMMEVKPVKGLFWGASAIGNAEWTGVRLRDVLMDAGVNEDDSKFKHVWFEGMDLDPTSTPYSASIPFWKAMDKYGDVILAYKMNGEPLPKDHGYPVRVIVPGHVGARNVKWLGRIYVSSKENPGFWQQNDYKGFSPSTDWDTVDFTKSPAIQTLPVISAICVPQPNETIEVKDGFITVKGYAWSGNGQKIIRVDLTVDGGKTWHVANLDVQDKNDTPKHWTWTLWSAKIPVKPNEKNIILWAKAVDSSYNVQPENVENIWNLRGVLTNAYHRVPINLKHK